MPTLTFDTTAWSDEERSLFVASAVRAAVLDCAPPIDCSGHSQARTVVSGGSVTSSIDFPAAASLAPLTEAVVRSRYSTDKAARDAASAAEAQELADIATYVAGDTMTGARIAAVKAAVDEVFTDLEAAEADVSAATNLATLRAATLKLAAVLRKTLVLERSHLRQHYVRGHFGPR